MPATITVTPDERPALGFAMDRVALFYMHGTAEQRESAQTLVSMLRGLEQTPAGTVEMDFLTQDAYLLGIRLYSTAVELEQYWLDARERAEGRGERLPPVDPQLETAVRHFFPEVVENPREWDFDRVSGIFTELGFKFDRAVTEATPRVRGMYNADHEEMVDNAHEFAAARARLRAGGHADPGGAVAVEAPPVPSTEGWGVEVQTGLTPDDIPAESFRPFTVGSVRLLITNFGGRLTAIQGTCSHQAANLSKGRVEGAVIECPRHGAEFDLRSGRQVCPPFCEVWMEREGMKAALLKAITPDKRGGDLLAYPLRIENGEIVLRI
jgi:3-phenylpropionate/trans-cinnamate dioxygenase ferredoxin subunit